MSRIKLIALDMDGTTLNSERNIDDVTLNAIRKAIDSGIMIVPASGRPFKGLPKQLLDLGLKYAITKNGSIINDLSDDGKEIFHETINTQKAIEIIEFLETKNCFIRFEYGNEKYVSENGLERMLDRFPAMEFDANRVFPSLARFLSNKPNALIDKIAASCFDEATFNEIIDEQKNHLDLNIMSSGYPFVEINSRMTSKGNALKHLATRLGINKEEISAIGDADNDLIMLSYAGYSFAMGNGSIFVRQAANEITLSNDEHGVAFAIEKILARNMQNN